MTGSPVVRIAGRTVEFPLPVTVLPPADGPVDIAFSWDDRQEEPHGNLATLMNDVAGAPWLLGGRVKDGWCLVQPDGFTAWVSEDGSRVRISRRGEAGVAVWEHLLLNVVLPHVLSLRGRLVLHAGAVAPPDRDVARVFVGEQGRGKSTRVARAVRDGWRLVTDDFLVVERRGGEILAHPGPRVLRLWSDSLDAVGGAAWRSVARPTAAADKWSVRLGDIGAGGVEGAVPIESIEVLDPPADGTANGRAAFLALHDAAFRVDVRGPEAVAADLDRFADPALVGLVRFSDPG